ncbi:MAG: hypothetical protein KGI61_01550 [Patescibacteria group bacterium]|nr:hypothetical protein [Patescibacteria group bacterium]
MNTTQLKHPVHFRSWTESDMNAVNSAESFEQLGEIAVHLLWRFPPYLHMSSGPMTTGGVGSLEGNLLVHKAIIELLYDEIGLQMWSQLPFEDRMAVLSREWHRNHPQEMYCMPLLEGFYTRVFSTRRIVSLQMIYGWQTSRGATWEADQCRKLGIRVNELPVEFTERAMGRARYS